MSNAMSDDCYIYRQNMPLSRVRAEKKLGRFLKLNEVVHHVDRNHSNDDPENLQVMSRNDHTSLHITGRCCSEKARQRISEAHLGTRHTEETRKKMSESHLGKHPLSEEGRKRISEAMKGNQNGLGRTHIVTEEFKQRISKAMMGNKHSLGHTYTPTEECRQRVSEAVKESWIERRKENAKLS